MTERVTEVIVSICLIMVTSLAKLFSSRRKITVRMVIAIILISVSLGYPLGILLGEELQLGPGKSGVILIAIGWGGSLFIDALVEIVRQVIIAWARNISGIPNEKIDRIEKQIEEE